MVILTWSAMACGYPGAGVYVGLAPGDEHVAVARGLGARQARLFIGARMRAESGLRSVHYYAVRDPSVARVIPVPSPDERQHIHLRFELAQNGNGETLRLVGSVAADAPQSGFVVTIGLPLQDEAAFFERLLGNEPVGDWEELFERLECADLRNGPRSAKNHRKAS